MNLHYWDYDYIYKIMKKKRCYICEEIIEGNSITYLPENNDLCSNACLVIYRKIKKKNE